MIEQSVSSVLVEEVITVSEEATASEVAQLFVDERIGSAVVVDPETEAPIGIVTEVDIMQQVAGDADVESVQVASFMTRDLVTITSDESVHRAATLMQEHGIRRLPVVEDGELVGIVTTTDLSHYLPRVRDAILRARDR